MEDASSEAQASLREALMFYEFWQHEVENLLERWSEYKEGIRA